MGINLKVFNFHKYIFPKTDFLRTHLCFSFSLPDALLSLHHIKVNLSLGFPGGAVVKSPPANAGDMGSSPGPGRSHMPRSS